MAWTALLVLLATVAGQAPALGPPYPRPGTTQIFENDVVAVWNVSWLQQKYPLHTHRYDLIGISYAGGDRIITQGNGPGRLVHTNPWVFQTNRANVTHVEEGASDPPMRAVLIELKRPAPLGTVGDGPDGLRQVIGPPAWENNRAAGWIVMPGAAPVPHRHVGDAVELVFDGGTSPKATFVPAGTVHAGPAAGDGGRVRDLRAQVGGVMEEDLCGTPHVSRHLCDGWRGRRAAPGRIGTGRGERQQASSPSALRITDVKCGYMRGSLFVKIHTNQGI